MKPEPNVFACHGYSSALRADTTKEAGVDKHSMTIPQKEHLCPETSMSQRPDEAPGLAPCARQWKYDFSCDLTGRAACVQPAWTQSTDSLCSRSISVVVTVETVKCSFIRHTVFYGGTAQLCCFWQFIVVQWRASFIGTFQLSLFSRLKPSPRSFPCTSAPSALTCHFLILCPAHPEGFCICKNVHLSRSHCQRSQRVPQTH